jgi:hypothetical protein
MKLPECVELELELSQFDLCEVSNTFTETENSFNFIFVSSESTFSYNN